MLEEVKTLRVEEYEKWHPSIFAKLDNLRYTFLDSEHRSKIPLQLSNSFQSYTDGKKIVVSMADFFLDLKYSKDFWMLMEKACTLHECQHLNSTLLKDWNHLVDSFGEWFEKNYKISYNAGRSVAHEIINIIEDGRIENIIVTNYQGYKRMFQIKNGEYWANASIRELAQTPGEEYEHFIAQIFAYAKCGGNNAFGVQVYHKKRLEGEFCKIQNDIDRAVASYSCNDCFKYIERILHAIAPYVAELIENDPDLMDELEDRFNMASGGDNEIDFNQNVQPGQGAMRIIVRVVPDESESEQNKNSFNNQQTENSNNSNKKSESQQNQKKSSNNSDPNESGENGNSGSGESGENGNSGNNANAKYASGENEKKILNKETFDQGVVNFANMNLQQRGYTEEELTEALKAIKQEMEKSNEGSIDTQRKISHLSTKVGKPVGNVAYTETKVSCGKSLLPANLKAQAKRLYQELTRILKDKYHNRIHTKKGQIDTQSLWKIPCKEDNLFQQMDKKKKPSVAIHLLIDNSGSMSEDKKAVAARHAAAVIEEAFSSLAACKISLFSASSMVHVHHYIVKDFDEKGRYNRSFNSLNTLTPCGGNKDGASIRFATEDLLKRNERRKFLIVLSDGLPSDYLSTNEALSDVQQAVDEARKSGVEVISIPFGSLDFIHQNQGNFKFMYRTNIVVANTDNIGKIMGNLFKKIIS